MKNWKRVKNCKICGENRCTENDWMIHCFRYQKTVNKRNFERGIGIEIPKNVVLRRGLGRSHKEENRKKDEELSLFSSDIFLDFECYE